MAYSVTIGTENNISVTQSLVGQQGAVGETGPQGIQGETGPQGIQGETGPQGIQGEKGLDWQGAWVLSTAYAVDDAVSNNGSSYICIQAHTSTSNDEPGVGAGQATYWELLAQKGLDGSGSGTVTSVATGTGLTGGPITSSGTVALDSASISSLSLADSALQSVSGTTDQVVVTDGDTISLAAEVTSSLALADTATQPGDLATVATSGAYADLSGTPNLSNVVESDVTGITGADQVTNIVSLTQAEYDAITPNASTVYIVVG